MAEPLRAEVLAVGDELLAGDITNRNAAWISARLVEVGVPVLRHTSVGDEVGIIAEAVREALARVGVVVVTGGLGPTQDDLTREGLARAAGVGLRRDPGLEAALRSAFAARGRMVPEMNYRMADVPGSASSSSAAWSTHCPAYRPRCRPWSRRRSPRTSPRDGRTRRLS